MISCDNALVCPICHGENLHQKDVEVFIRHEDAAVGRHVLIPYDQDRAVELTADMRLNPSGRRDGMRIYFVCEECSGERQEPILCLVIIQHKGTTYFCWEDKCMRPSEYPVKLSEH